MSNSSAGFIWYELLTDDITAASRFYGSVVGWSDRDAGSPDMDYRLWCMDGVPVGGLMTIPDKAVANGVRPMWLGYIHVPDVDAAIAATVSAGGVERMAPIEAPGVGRFATVTDPQGAPIYVMTPAGEGVGVSFAPGRLGSVGWNELRTTDAETALKFYETQFGWGRSPNMDMGPMGTYWMFNTGGDAIGGMMTLRDQRPCWLFYFNVEDIGAAKQRVEQGGGTVVNGPHEVPGGQWVVQGRDPQGAMFALVAPGKGGREPA
jgi:predicted enzyme related to lactoylglutathione lyase